MTNYTDSRMEKALGTEYIPPHGFMLLDQRGLI